MTPTATPDRVQPPVGRRRLPGLVALVGLALVALGAGAWLLAVFLSAGQAEVVGGNQPVNAGAADLRDIRAHNSPTVVRNPLDATNLVVVNRIDTPSFSCALHASRDGGASWSETDIPFPAGEELPERCYAPDAAFAPDGTLHVSFVTLAGRGNEPNAAWMVRSDDGGANLSEPIRVAGELAYQVRLAADPDTPGRLYLAWLQAAAVAPLGFPDTGYPLQVAVSEDGGRSWSPPRRVSHPDRARVLAPTPAVGPDGGLYVAYLDLGEDRLDYSGAHEGLGGPPHPGPWRLVLARSPDGGARWAETVIGELTPIERMLAFIPPFPAVAVDPEDGSVHVAFHDARHGDADVWMWTSTDDGARFTEATRVIDLLPGDGTAQYLPQLAVAPGGRLDVVYYDRRADPRNLMTETSLQSSHDGGATFGPRIRLADTAFDSRIGFGSERDLPDLGSRLGLSSTRTGALAVWADTRAGTMASNKQDLSQAMVAFPAGPDLPEPARTGLRLGGLGLVVAGLGMLARWAMTARRPAAY